jgi:hypothetical protein
MSTTEDLYLIEFHSVISVTSVVNSVIAQNVILNHRKHNTDSLLALNLQQEHGFAIFS